MLDKLRSLEEIDRHLALTPALTSAEPQRILRELCMHLIRQQKEIAGLKKDDRGDRIGTRIIRNPDGKIHL